MVLLALPHELGARDPVAKGAGDRKVKGVRLSLVYLPRQVDGKVDHAAPLGSIHHPAIYLITIG